MRGALKKTRKALLFALCVLLFASSFSAGRVSASPRIDISGGSFSGKTADYKFNIPKEWKNGAVYAENAGIPFYYDGLLEQIKFYCLSETGQNKPELLFSLLVFKISKYKDYDGVQLVVKGSLYVFAVSYPEKPRFNNLRDETAYNNTLAPVSAPEKLRSFIVRSEADAVSSAYVYVNSAPLPGNVAPLSFYGIYYVPLRAVCETLGYNVRWVAESSYVVIEGVNFYDSFKATDVNFSDARGLRMRTINNRIYVQTAYFTQVLRKTVDVDVGGNVYIYK